MTANETTPTGKGMDLSFLGRPHEYDPRRTYSTTATDWQARVDFGRLRHPRRDAVLVALAGPATNLVLATVSAFVLGLLPPPQAASASANLLRDEALASLTINCVLAVFNLIPVPPLDGGRVLTAFLPTGAARALARVETVGLLIVLLVVMNSNVIGRLVRPVIEFLLRVTGS